MLSLHPCGSVGVELRFHPSSGISSPQSLAQYLRSDTECDTPKNPSTKTTSSPSSLSSSSKTSQLMKQIATALEDNLLILIRTNDTDNNNGDIDLSPEDIRTLYTKIHEYRYPQFQIRPPEMAREKWSDENIRGVTFPNYNETQILGFAESISDWHGLSGRLQETGFWCKQSGQYHHDGGFSSSAPIPPALVGMYCKESPTTSSCKDSEDTKYPIGSTLFFSTGVGNIKNEMLLKRAKRMRCVYVEAFGRVQVDAGWPVMSSSYLTPTYQSPVVLGRNNKRQKSWRLQENAWPQPQNGNGGDSGWRSITEIVEPSSFVDRQTLFESGGKSVNEKDASGGVFKHLLVQCDDDNSKEYIVVHTVCLDHLEELRSDYNGDVNDDEEKDETKWVALSWEESQNFIEELLLPLSASPLALDWRPGDFAIFDNLRLQHSVTPYDWYMPMKKTRLMTRTTMQPVLAGKRLLK